MGLSTSSGLDRIFQVVGTTSDTSSIELIRHTADTAASKLDFSKSRNGTIGSNTVVQANDVLGDIIFRGDDGTDLNSEAAKISAVVDGTPGSNDMPGRLTFWTSADGSNSPTERMRIDSSGRVGIGVTPNDFHANNTAVLQLKDGNAIFSRTGGHFLGVFENINYNCSDVSQYVANGLGSAYFQASGVHKFYSAPSGTANNNATLSEKLRIDTAGQLGIGGANYGSSGQVLTSGGGLSLIHI